MISLLIAFFGFVSVASAQTVPSALIEGSLVQALGDPRVYYLQDSQKRWVVSEQAFLAQGFRWSDVTVVDRERLAQYPDGSEISVLPALGLPVDWSLLPDLAPVAPYDLSLAAEGGQTRLRFTATFWNRGKGALELTADPGTATGDSAFDAFQHIFKPDGSFTSKPVGTLFWHDIHGHYHYDDFGQYVLEMVRPAAGATLAGPIVTQKQKTTFCMRDDLAIGAPADGAKQLRTYTGCRGHRQGVSVGWADVYANTLADQYLDVTNLPAGVYKLSFSVDPSATFAESRRENNVSATLFELDPSKSILKVLGAASPYESPNNRLPDGMLIRGEGDSNVYVIHANKKRWLRTEQVFVSYGYSWGNIYVLPKGAVAIIPQEKLIRAAGTGTIFTVNEAGYRRRILNPDVLRSYGWTTADAAEVNQTELSSYPETDFVIPTGSDRVYSIGTRRFVGVRSGLTSLGIEPQSVHPINATDFSAYAVTTVAQNLFVPWDVAILPDGDILATERSGSVRRIGKQPAVMSVASVLIGGEGGLMGIALDPNFSENSYVYLYFTTTAKKNRVTRFRLEGTKLLEDKVILDGIPSATYHDGGQVAFGPDGKLYVATGDSQQPDLAQDTQSLAGKVLRMNTDGSIPADNPFGNLVWSYGHRNPQGLAWDESGTLYETEHGPTGEFDLCCRDELNRIQKGGNYGWPVITGDQKRDGMFSPLLMSGVAATWAPSGIAVSGGRLFFAGLRGSTLYGVTLGENGVTNLKTYLNGVYGRLRAVVAGPDGSLYITTSNRDGRGTVKTGDDKILRIYPDFIGVSP